MEDVKYVRKLTFEELLIQYPYELDKYYNKRLELEKMMEAPCTAIPKMPPEMVWADIPLLGATINRNRPTSAFGKGARLLNQHWSRETNAHRLEEQIRGCEDELKGLRKRLSEIREYDELQ